MDIVTLTKRHPKVGETVFGSNLNFYPGGKGANQAVSSSKLGGKTTMVGKVGDDSFGKELKTFLTNAGVITLIHTSSDTPTGTAIITVSEDTSDNSIVVVPGANYQLNISEIDQIKFAKGDILVSQFEIPVEVVKFFFWKGRESGTLNILNPAPAMNVSDNLLSLIDVLILNETELEIISKSVVDISDENSIAEAVFKFKKENQSVLVTLGEKGVIAYINDSLVRVAGHKVKALDSTGAGDCFVGAIAAKLSTGASLIEALEFANKAASICVTRMGAGPSMPNLDEVNHY